MTGILKSRLFIGSLLILIFIIGGGYIFLKQPSSPEEEIEAASTVVDTNESSSLEEIVTEDSSEEDVDEVSFIPDIIHVGDLVVSGNETLLIEGTRYFQQGNVYVNDEAKLIIRDSQFMLGRGDVPTIHVYIIVESNAELIIENSTLFQNIFPEAIGHPVHIIIQTRGTVSIKDSPTAVHLMVVSEGAQVMIINSQLVNLNPPGGLVQISSNTDTKIINSTIGAIGLTVPENTHLTANGLRSGVNLKSWSIHDIIPDANYSVVLENTDILKDEVEPGPYERGWIFFIDPQAYVNVTNSELRKVFIDIRGGEAYFESLKIKTPSSLKVGNIELSNITVRGQWSFTMTDANVTITDSEYLFLQPFGTSKVYLVNSQMVEFIPRNFFGTMYFSNSRWNIAGEFFGDLSYHSLENNFTLRGSLKIGQELRHNLQWKDANVVREYDVLVLDKDGEPVVGAQVSINGMDFTSDSVGRLRFELVLNESNYETNKSLELSEGGAVIVQKDIDFFTETPIILYKK